MNFKNTQFRYWLGNSGVIHLTVTEIGYLVTKHIAFFGVIF